MKHRNTEPQSSPIRILIISTSLKPVQSRSRIMARVVESLLGQEPPEGDNAARAAECRWLDLRQHPLPFCDADAYANDANVQEVKKLVAWADGVVIAVPIYNYDGSAAAKNLIEVTGDAWNDKVVAFVCAAGGSHSYMAPMGLANSLMLDFRSVIVPRFVYASGGSFEGDTLTDDVIKTRLDNLAQTLVAMTRALRDGGVV